jgi:cob(I)alamin adenosyltransferase
MQMLQVYTGNGRGKTSAAFGLAIRGAMAGKNVFIGQFIKGMKYNETKIEQYIDNITIEQFGKDCFIENEPTEEDLKRAEIGFKKIIEKASTYDIIILDELAITFYFKLLALEDVLQFLKAYKDRIEIIITGRNCPEEIIAIADLVTEMKEIKHYYQQGVLSREGFDK